MKIRDYLYSIIAGVLFLTGCAKDNFEAPQSKITGRVVYNGEPIGVRSTGVAFELWQHGYQLFSSIALNVAQDGSFSSLVFDGKYKLVRTKGSGPWVDVTDSIDVNINGSATVDVPVTPYYFIKDVAYLKTGKVIEATFTIQNVNTTKALELVRLYLGPNLIIDQINNSANQQALASAINTAQPIKLQVTIPASFETQDYIFARVGVKTVGIAELLYSAPQKIQLK